MWQGKRYKLVYIILPPPSSHYFALFTLCVCVCSYESLRTAFSDLRGQLIHLTGRDPLQENHPLGALPIKV